MKKKIKIGLFIDTFFPMVDGVTMVVDNYAKRLTEIADVTVFAPELKDSSFDDTSLNYKVVRCKSLNVPFLDYSLPMPKSDKRFMEILNSSKLDIVHIHSPFTIGKVGVEYAKKNKIPCIATMHSQFKRDFQKVVKYDFVATKMVDTIIKVFNQCDECWAVNSEIARIFHEDYKYKTLPKVMNNATEMIPVKNKKKAREFINDKYKIKEDERVFLFVGRINTLKNILFIVDSLHFLKKKNKKIKFKMLFVGSGQDENKLDEKIKSLNLEKEVLMCGRINDREELASLYERADLFLFPSVYDASSIVQIEAASQKTPTVFLRGTATASTVKDNVNGFLSEYSIESYATKIEEVLTDDKLYNKVKNNSFKDLYKNWDDLVKEVYEKYLELIKNYKDKK